MLVIRLSRIGRKNKAVYRIVISENTKDTFGNHLEQLGFYNPGVKPKEIKLEKERIQYWLSKGAQPSATVHNLLVDAGIIEGKKVKASQTKKNPKKEELVVKSAPAEVKAETAEEKNEVGEEKAVTEEKIEEPAVEEKAEVAEISEEQPKEKVEEPEVKEEIAEKKEEPKVEKKVETEASEIETKQE